VKQHTSAPTKALIAVDETFFISGILLRLPEMVGSAHHTAIVGTRQ
jgi:hypothetical protein